LVARGALLVVLLVCLAALFGVGCSAFGAAPRPNIILVLTDDLDFASTQKMPELRSLLTEEGVSFENAFASQPLCCPARATILTGLYSHNHGVKENRPPDGGFEKFRNEGLEETTIAARLQQEGGYQTALFGKYLNGYTEAAPGHVPPGWDEWYGKLIELKPYNYAVNHNGKVAEYGRGTENFYTDVLSGQVTDFVRRAAPDPRPFFMYVAPTTPHDPATPAERHKGAFADEEVPHPPSFNEEDVSDKPSWIQKTDRFSEEDVSKIDDYYRQRLESMLAVDEMVASLVEELEAAGELDNTYIFFNSDNGYLQGEHRENKKDRPYEESARVPLYVRGPGIPAGSKVEKLALNTDLAPTFADLAGVGFPADGRSLKPLLRGEDPQWRSAVLLEGFVGNRARAYGAIRTEAYKYVEYANGERELYGLEADPYEMESLHESADPSLVEGLKTELAALRSCAGDGGCQEAEDAP